MRLVCRHLVGLAIWVILVQLVRLVAAAEVRKCYLQCGTHCHVAGYEDIFSVAS